MPLLKLTDSDPGVEIADWAALDAWVDAEQAQWSWVWDNTAAGGAGTAREKFRSAFRQLRNSFVRSRQNGHGLSTGFESVKSAFSHDGQLIHHRSSMAKEIGEVREALSDDHAVFALGFLRRLITLADASTSLDVMSALWLASPGYAAHDQLAKLLKRERENARLLVRGMLDELRKAQADRQAEWSELLQEARHQSIRWARKRSTRWRAATRGWEDRHKSAENDIRAVEKAYRDFMGLEAPVQYWKDKAGEHGAAERRLRGWLYIYFPSAILLLSMLFGGSAWYLLAHSDATPPPGLYVIASAGLASVAGVLFWVGRLLTKLYLSEHHLRHDAEERATMTTTYMALKADAAAQDNDRQIVLAALFRSTPDGIVKEEGGLDPSLASALGRFLAR